MLSRIFPGCNLAWTCFTGYTNEVGEAFRPLIHKNLVNLSYAAATVYVLADVRDKVVKMKSVRSIIYICFA